MTETLDSIDIPTVDTSTHWLHQRVEVSHRSSINWHDKHIGWITRKVVGTVVDVPHARDSRIHPTLVIKPELILTRHRYEHRKTTEKLDTTNPPDVIVMLEDLTYDIKVIEPTSPYVPQQVEA